MTVLLNADKAFDKTQHPCMVIEVKRWKIQGPYPNRIKTIYSKQVANIKLNGEELEAIPVKSDTKLDCPLSPYLFNIVLEVLTRAIKQQKDENGIKINKEEVKVSLFADNMIIYLSDSKNITRELLNLINNFSKMSG